MVATGHVTILTISFSAESIQAVKNWLVGAGIAEDRIKQTQSLGWLSFDASVDEAESLLNTQYHVYEHSETGQPHVACDEYSLPVHIQKHVDFITPTVHFDAKVKPRDGSDRKRDVDPNAAKGIGKPSSGSLPKFGQWLPKNSIITQLQNCDKQITPWCLRLLYKFPPG